MYIRVNVTPLAKRELVTCVSPDRYDVSVREPAERNLANGRVRELLARELSVPLGSLKLVSGHRSPHKIFSVNASIPLVV